MHNTNVVMFPPSLRSPRTLMLLVVFVAVCGTLARPAASQQLDPLISYQGRLTDDAGEPVADTDHTIVFKLYDQKTGGSPLWQETQNVPTSNGVFSVRLGSVNALDGLSWDATYYLGIEVDGGEELTPRTRFTETPYAMRARSVDDEAVTTSSLQDGAVTSAKLDRRSITSEKFDYGAVDSAAIDPAAVTKTLRPLLEVNGAEDFVGINRESPVTGSDVFGVQAPVDFDDSFGGMYINTEGAESWPFYGYATAGEAHAWHVYDHQEKEWILEFDHTSPRHRLIVDGNAVKPGGDGDIALGTADHRWSEVFSQNGTVQTSDRRLKRGIESLEYGLDAILQLDPVSYRWKASDSGSGDGDETHLGLVAQEVQEVVEEVVEQPEEADGYLGMNYSELVPVLIKAVQQQQRIIEKQEAQLRSDDRKLEAEVKALQEQVRALAERVESSEQEDVRPAAATSR